MGYILVYSGAAIQTLEGGGAEVFVAANYLLQPCSAARWNILYMYIEMFLK